MLTAKEGVVNENQEEKNKASGWVPQGFGPNLFWDMYKEDLKDPDLKWRQTMKHKDKQVEYTMYQRPNKAGGVDLVRIDQVYHDMPMEAFLEMVHRDTRPENAVVFDDLEIVSEKEKIIYARLKIPFMSEREAIIRMKREDLDDGSAIVIVRTMDEHKDVPLNPKYVRNEMMVARWFKPVKENPKDL